MESLFLSMNTGFGRKSQPIRLTETFPGMDNLPNDLFCGCRTKCSKVKHWPFIDDRRIRCLRL